MTTGIEAVVTIAIKIIKEGSAILRDDIRPELGVVHIISDGSEEVNEFLEVNQLVIAAS